jgi:hypothetical protein
MIHNVEVLKTSTCVYFIPPLRIQTTKPCSLVAPLRIQVTKLRSLVPPLRIQTTKPCGLSPPLRIQVTKLRIRPLSSVHLCHMRARSGQVRPAVVR